jgi:antitoxin component YwqK of YwqJK toxin-antitoxin module
MVRAIISRRDRAERAMAPSLTNAPGDGVSLLTVDATPESSPEAAAPPRPATVPDTGVWDAEAGKWEVVGKDDRGAREGERLLYRDDGTLYSRARFAGGVPEGSFVVYHRDGSVAREGRYVGGRLDGTVNAYASATPDGERIRSCCVPPGAARLCERYRAGEFLLETFYDRDGRALLSDGRLCPVRPDGLPELAKYDEGRGGWALHSRELDRSWSDDGRLREEVVHLDGGARVVRTFDAAGRLVQECGFGPDDKADGDIYRRFPDGEPGPYADARIRQERGAYAGGQAIGRWTFMGADGQVLRTVDRGAPFHDDESATSLTAQAANADWLPRARALAAGGRLREALVLAGRGAVAAGDRAAFERLRGEHVVPLTAEREAQWGEALAQSTDTNVATVLDALVCGADAAAAFRALASVLPGTSPAALELIEASLLLAPERRLTHLTRALLRFQRGDREGALADADVVAGESAEAADSLRSYAAMVFRDFDLWPWRERLPPEPALDGVALEPGQGLDGVRHAIGVYATRLARARAALRGLVPAGQHACLPPDTSHLLPSGEVDLRRETIECEPDDGDGAADGSRAAGAADPPAPETIEIDEQLTTEGLPVPLLLAGAHADWAALCWLCWAVGLDEVALPSTIAPRPELAVATQWVVQRTWRIKDRLSSGGLIGRAQGVPGFEWQGVDIDALPRHLVEVAAHEYVAVRSMLIWLAAGDALSPFQDDIRDA